MAKRKSSTQADSSESQAEYSEDARVGAAKSTRPTRTLSPEHAAAVCNYVNDFKGGRRGSHIIIQTVMLGQVDVGMYCLIVRFILDAFLVNYDPTRDEMIDLKTYIEGKLVCLEGSMERFSSQWSAKTWPQGLGSPYLKARHCEACILVYDVTNRESFEAVRLCYDNFCLERSLERPQSMANYCACRQDCPPRPPFRGLFFVIANKIDRDEAEWTVSNKEGEDFCASIGAIFMPMSAKTGEGSGSNALLEIVNHVLFRRIENKPLLEGETTSNEEESKRTVSPVRTRLSRCWSKFVRRRVQNRPRLESERASNEDVSRVVESHSPELHDPNELYQY